MSQDINYAEGEDEEEGNSDGLFNEEEREEIMRSIPHSKYVPDNKPIKMSEVSLDEEGNMTEKEVEEEESAINEDNDEQNVVKDIQNNVEEEKTTTETAEKPESEKAEGTVLFDSRTGEKVVVDDEEIVEDTVIRAGDIKKGKNEMFKKMGEESEKFCKANNYQEAKQSEELSDADIVVKEVKQQKNTQLLSEIVSSDSIYKINPAIDFYRNQVFITFPLNVEDKKTKAVHLAPYIFVSGRYAFPIKSEYVDELKIRVKTIPSYLKEKVGFQFLTNYLNLNISLDKFYLKDVFEKVKKEMERYIYFESDEDYSFVSLWILGTYWHQLFGSFPYLYIGGSKRCGKSKLLDFISCLAFNAQKVISPTMSTIYRMINDSSCTLLFDEEYKVANKEESDFRSVLLGGYKKGGVVPRNKEGEKKTYDLLWFDTFCPKAYANIEGIDDVMSDRSVSIIMSRYNKPDKANNPVNFGNHIWQTIREKIYQKVLENEAFVYSKYTILWFLKRWWLEDSETFLSTLTPSILQSIYKYYILYTNTTHNPLETHKEIDSGKDILEELYQKEIKNSEETEENVEVKKKKSSITARYFEIYHPMLITALVIDVEKLSSLNNLKEFDCEKIITYFREGKGIFFEMIEYIEKKIEERENEQKESKDATYFSMLYKFMLLREDDEYYVSEILKEIRVLEAKNYTEKELAMLTYNTPFGRFLKKHKIAKSRRRDGRGVKILILKERVLQKAKQYGIDLISQFKDFNTTELDDAKEYHKANLSNPSKAKSVKGAFDKYKKNKSFDDEYNHEESVDND